MYIRGSPDGRTRGGAQQKLWWRLDDGKNAEKGTKMGKEKTKKNCLDESSSHSDMPFLDIKGI